MQPHNLDDPFMQKPQQRPITPSVTHSGGLLVGGVILLVVIIVVIVGVVVMSSHGKKPKATDTAEAVQKTGATIQQNQLATVQKSEQQSSQVPSEPSSAVKAYDPTAHPNNLKLSVNDTQRYDDLTGMTLANTSFYLKNGHYFTNATEAGQYIGTHRNYKDPQTQQPYIVTDTTPKRGEVMYKFATTCANNLRGPGQPASDRVYMFMTLLDDGSFICKSNVQ